MAAAGWLTYTYWSFGAGTAADKALFRRIGQLKPRRIVEVGIGSLDRACNLIAAAQRFAAGDTIRYTGIDWFEERTPPLSPMPLIHAYRELQSTGATVRLMPGTPGTVLPQAANALQRTDLILISADVQDQSLQRAWFYLPRMCQTGTLVLRETRDERGRLQHHELPAAELSSRASAAQPKVAA
jgi:hypothetical protein